jgi:hypothetical protein
MRGDDLLLVHLAALSDPPAGGKRPSAQERLDAKLGAELARVLVAALTGARAASS